MRKTLVLALVSVFASALVAQGAAKKEGPTPAEIARAGDKAVYKKEDTAVNKLPKDQGEVRFIPAKIGDFNDAQIAQGVIIGKLDTPHKTVDGNPPGMYQVYLCKEGGRWNVYYCQKGEVVAKAQVAEVGKDNVHKPVFVERGHLIAYWFVKFSW